MYTTQLYIPIEVDPRLKAHGYKFQPQTDGSAAIDLVACLPEGTEQIIIKNHETIVISTGIKVAIPQGYFGMIAMRSSKSTKEGLRLANQVGVIDSDYRGTIVLPCCVHRDLVIINDRIFYDPEPCTIKNFERIAQLIIVPIPQVNYVECVDLEETYPTTRGSNGLGSTGK